MTPSTKPGIAAYLSKHDKAMTVFGAIMLFVTFIVNEHILEHFKETVAAAELAKEFYALSDQNRRIEGDLAELRRNTVPVLDNIGNESVITDKTLDDLNKAQDYRYTQSRDDLNDTRARLDQIGNLLEQVPNTSDATKLADYNNKFDTVAKNYYAHPMVHITRDIPPLQLVTINKACQDACIAVDVLSSSVVRFQGESANHASDAAKEERKGFSRWTWISIGLYVLAWGLTLIGKLYGVKGLAES
jgi:hypothetical protein